jgi:hypothetical protein
LEQCNGKSNEQGNCQNVKVFQIDYILTATTLPSDYQRFAIHAISHCETGRLGLPNGPFRAMKQAVSQAKTTGMEML